MRRILARALEAAGYRVVEAPDGQVALAACRARRPRSRAARHRHAGHGRPDDAEGDEGRPELLDIPVLFLTARTSGDDLAAGLELGAQDYLRKPCEPAELIARVAAALRQRVQAETLRGRALEADRLSTVDALTGVANRRQFDMRTAEMLAAMGRDAAIGLMVIDVDHFKRVNDEEGHPVGDAVLRIVAARLSEVVGDEHLLVRWGGEEFVVLATALAARRCWPSWARRCARVISDSPFAIDEDRSLEITVSVGCVSGRLGELDDAWPQPTRRSTTPSARAETES